MIAKTYFGKTVFTGRLRIWRWPREPAPPDVGGIECDVGIVELHAEAAKRAAMVMMYLLLLPTIPG